MNLRLKPLEFREAWATVILQRLLLESDRVFAFAGIYGGSAILFVWGSDESRRVATCPLKTRRSA